MTIQWGKKNINELTIEEVIFALKVYGYKYEYNYVIENGLHNELKGLLNICMIEEARLLYPNNFIPFQNQYLINHFVNEERTLQCRFKIYKKKLILFQLKYINNIINILKKTCFVITQSSQLFGIDGIGKVTLNKIDYLLSIKL